MKSLKKLFKNFALFDYSALLIILTILFVAFFFFYRKSVYIDIRVKITDQEILYASESPLNWYADRFIEGDVERDVLGRVISEIKNVETFNVSSLQKAVYLDIRVKATYDSRTKLYSARGKTLVFGAPVKFNLSGITFEGIVTEFPNSEFQKNIVITNEVAEVLVKGVRETMNGKEFIEPQVINSIMVGDNIIDSNGVILAEVININVRPTKRVTQDDKGNLLLVSDPYYKDALITLKLRTKIVNKTSYIFDNFPLRLNEELLLTFNNLFVKSKIIKIYSL